jgi:hypothetical protein
MFLDSVLKVVIVYKNRQKEVVSIYAYMKKFV